MKKIIIISLEEAADYAVSASPEECAAAEEFGNERRRAEFLAWRGIVRRELGCDVAISYSATGAPQVDVEGVHISVSHCGSHVAVVFSDRPCAVDVESVGRNFSRAVRHFASAEELEASDNPLWHGILWCAKEVMYKLSGRKELDLRRDISIRAERSAADGLSGIVSGSICGGEAVELVFEIAEGLILIYKV